MAAQTDRPLQTQEFFVQTLQDKELGFFDMPPAPYSTLLETFMRRWMTFSHITSWSTASLMAAVLFSMLFFGVSLLDLSLLYLPRQDLWKTLMFPTMGFYLLLGATQIRHLLNNTVQNLRHHAPTEYCHDVLVKTYHINRRGEWMGVLAGIGGYLLLGPVAYSYWDTPFQGGIQWALFMGSIPLGGLLGWYIYSSIHFTYSISTIFDTIPETTKQKPLVLIRPILMWGVGISLFFMGIALMKLIFWQTITYGGFEPYSFLLIVLWQLWLISKVFIRVVWPHLQGYIEMPPSHYPHIIDEAMSRWMRLTGIRSWFLACLLITVVIYIIGLFVSWSDSTFYLHSTGLSWWNKLLYPFSIFYLLMMPVFIRHLFNETITAMMITNPTNNPRLKESIQSLYDIDRGVEWLMLLVGAGGYLLISLTLEHPSQAATLYNTICRAIIFALMAWIIYVGLTKSKRLGQYHQHVNDMNLFGQHISVEPIMRWNIGIALSFVGGIIISSIFLPDWFNLSTAITYSVLVSATALVFVFSKVPTALLPWFRMVRIILIFVLVCGIGTIGFYYLEQDALSLTPLDAFYMTVITMTTIGYGDITPVTREGRMFTIVLSVIAVGISTYAISALASFLVEGDLNQILWGRKMAKDIATLDKHIILCGAGRVGLKIAAEFHKTQTPFVIVEKNTSEIEELVRIGEVLYVEGDATRDEVLLTAGIQRASALVTTLDDDKDNAFVVLTARSLNPNSSFRIISRLSDEENREKLRKAGATEIVSPHAIGGLRMASVVLRPSVVNFLDSMLRAEQLTGETLRIEEIMVDDLNAPALVGKEYLSIIDVGRHTQLMVIAIQSEDGDYQYKPRGDIQLKSKDVLIVIGTPAELAHARGF